MNGSMQIENASFGNEVECDPPNAGRTGPSSPVWGWSRWGSSVLTVFALLVLGVWIFGSAHRSTGESDRRIPDAARPVLGNGSDVLVRTYRVPNPSSEWQNERSLVGTLQPRYQSPLGFRIGGKVIARHVETGDHVVQGQLLMQLDPEDAALQAEVAQSEWIAARSILSQAEAEESRLQPLLRNGSVSKSEYDLVSAARDTARARLDAAQRRKRLAENQKEYCELRADRDGMVTSLNAEIGQVVAAGQAVMHWMQGEELEAAVSVPESMQREIRRLQPEITFWSRPGLRLAGRLRELSPIATLPSRMYDARFELIDAPKDLPLGMTATVHLADSESIGIRIPMSAIAQRDDQPSVWRVQRDGSLQNVAISIVRFESEHAIVRGNLYEGDELVSAGVQKLDPECRVRVWKDSR
jgi:multidrug efflux system membrane fusion protein